MSNQLEEQLLAAIDTTKNALRVTGGGGSSSVVTSADDTTTTLTTASESQLVVSGSGVLQEIDLGDATTYDNGKTYRVHNASSEFVGVKNSDSTAWERVPPCCTLTAILLDNSTAAGVWCLTRTQMSDRGEGIELHDEFYSWIGDNSLGWTESVSGTGASISNASNQAFMGMSQFSTGTTATGYANQALGRGTPLAQGALGFESALVANDLSTASEEYAIWFGLGDSTAAAPTSGVYFKYDRATAGDFWRIAAQDASEDITTTTAVPTTFSTFQCLRGEVASDASRADFWVDKTHVGTVTAQIPSSSGGIFFRIEKSVGTTARVMFNDYCLVQKAFTTSRRG
jgi:hypothetical protein